VTDTAKGGSTSALVTVARGEVTLSERADAAAAAHVTGTEEAWLRAFAPEGTLDGLAITGDQTLASSVLDGLVRTESAAAAAAAAA
jgi:hypothetical protein